VALEKLPGWVWDLHEKKWQEGFAHLKKYIQHHGSIDVSQLFEFEGFRLGTWISTQRCAYRRGRLPMERQKLLESLPAWEWPAIIQTRTRKAVKKKKSIRLSWEDKLQCLRKYVKQHGHTYVPRRHVLKNGFDLGRWIADQRYRYKQGVLPKERQDALESIPTWTWIGKRGIVGGVSREWIDSFGRLQEYVKREGHADVPPDYKTKDRYKLGAWVSSQRGLVNTDEPSNTKLTEEQIELLEQLPGWTWVGRRESAWAEAYELLKEYCANEGNARVHQHYRTKTGYALGSWVKTQRKRYRNGKLSKERQKRLRRLPGWTWHARKDRRPTG